MNRLGIKTIRFRLIAMVVTFTFVILTVFTAVMAHIFVTEQRRSVIQSTEFNLQLVAKTIDENVKQLFTLSLWSTGNETLRNYLRGVSPSGIDAIRTYERLSEEYRSNPANEYVRRMIVSDGEEKLVQVGANVTQDTPVTLYYMRLSLAQLAQDPEIETLLATDLLARAQPQVLLILRPIVLSSSRKGISYMAVNTNVITRPLENYVSSETLYLTTKDGDAYAIGQNALIPVEAAFQNARSTTDETLDPATKIHLVTGADGERYTVVSYPLSTLDGWTISHRLSAEHFTLQSSFAVLLLCIGGLVIVLAVILSAFLERIITRPVYQLRGRLSCIAGGDFSRDDTIEWSSELGDVGRGINRLSSDVSRLMDSRVADEKSKRDLEFRMLQNQVNPHFIYNTLNSIKWMATIQNATGIAEMTTAFSHLLKSVAKSSEEMISLREEFSLLNDYCTIQQYRYGGSITLEIAEITDEHLCECLIPRFTLQPLAENAIFHGIEPKGGVGSIWLHIRQTEVGDLCISMQDDGVGMSEETIRRIFSGDDDTPGQKFKQIGVCNVHRRIQYAFGEKYGISIESEVNQFTRMNVLIPCHYPASKEETDV